MWNAGYNFGEHQNGYGYNEFNYYQQGNRYSDFYKQQQPVLYPDYYQPSSLQEPYFTSSEQYYPPQDQPTYDLTEIRAMMLQQNENFARAIEELKIRQVEIVRQLAHNAMMDNRFDSHIASESDQFEVLNNDIEVKIVGEDVNEEEVEVEDCSDEEEIAENKKSGENRSVGIKTDRFFTSNVNKEIASFGTDRFEPKPIGFGPKFPETRESDTETDWLPPEATPNVDSTCLDSFEDGTDSYNEVDHLMYALLTGEGLTKEHRERALEIVRTAKAHVPETEIIESEHPYNEELHHGEPSSSPTCVDLRFEQGKETDHTSSEDDTDSHMRDPLEALICLGSCADTVDTNSATLDALEAALNGKMLTREQSERVKELAQLAFAADGKEANHKSSVENSVLVQQSEDQQPLVVDQASVGLSNKRKLEWPSAKTYSETPLLKRHRNTSEHLLSKESVWGRKKNFELTGEGDYGGYLGRSYGGFRDQFYIDPDSSTGGIWSRNEYHGPWFND